jgi:uncharacterized protein YfaS (alpha-2-macroglobulin family)
VAFYAPEVMTDERGHAEVSFKLPDSLTRFRIMAVAVSRDGLGSGEAAVRTKKPLMLRAMLPRVFHAGDRASAGAVVHNDTARELEVEVRAEAEGVTLSGDAKKKVRVPRGQGVEVRFALEAARVGTAKLRFVAEAGKERDAFEVERKVLAPTPLETVSTSGQSEPRAAEALGTLQGVRDDLGGLEVKLTTSALGELEAPARELVDYPYACTEQLSSRLVGLAALARLHKRGLVEAGDYEKRASAVLSELERHQRYDGSFGLWSSEDPASFPPLDAFLTGYALVSIKAAERAGITISGHVLERARGFLAGYLRGERHALSGQLAGADLAFVVLALAEIGSFDASYAHTLFEGRAKLSLLARVELARAYPADADERKVLFDELKSAMRVTADEAHLEQAQHGPEQLVMASSVRASAEALLLWLAVDGENPMVPKLARWLSASRELDGTWGSTQESAWGLTALAAYMERVEGEPADLSARAWLNDRQLGEARLKGAKASAGFHVPMRELSRDGARLTVAREGKGRLYYTMRLSYARGELPSTGLERGFAVEREYECIGAGALARGDIAGTACTKVKAGDYVRVILRVAVPATRRFILLADPLPAGLEPLNFALTTSPQAATRALGFELAPVDHTQLFDDRAVFAVTQLQPGLYRYGYLTRATTSGTFVAPPAHVEEMYHPETFARTAARTFEVVAP